MYTVIDPSEDNPNGTIHANKNSATETANPNEIIVPLNPGPKGRFSSAILQGLAEAANKGALSPREDIQTTLNNIHPYLQQEIFNGFLLPVLELYAEIPHTDARNQRAVTEANRIIKPNAGNGNRDASTGENSNE